MSYHVQGFMQSVSAVAHGIPWACIEDMVDALVGVRKDGGRLFFLGVGGSAANASHAVNDFRKICQIESYCPTDNVAELTARTNDEGWDDTFGPWLSGSRLNPSDAIFVLSVGGGNDEKNVSRNIVRAVQYAKVCGSTIFGIVGRDGGFTARKGTHVIVVPTVNVELVTPLTESFQSVILHALVSHPKLAMQQAKWEGMV